MPRGQGREWGPGQVLLRGVFGEEEGGISRLGNAASKEQVQIPTAGRGEGGMATILPR